MVMELIVNPKERDWNIILKRPSLRNPVQEQQVADLMKDLKNRGWEAVLEMTRMYDGYLPEPAQISQQQLKEAGNRVPVAVKEAIAQAARNIQTFHEAQRPKELAVEVSKGITCRQRWVPVEKVGLYVPGGTAPLISTVLMLALPAQIAGCTEIILCTPGNDHGEIDPAIRYAAHYCGITQLYRLGGVQAIGSMAYGLGSVPKVDKIFGPGNSWVTLAKQWVAGEGVAIDMPAGPSEVAIIADRTCHPSYIAADLLSQAEHGSDSQVLLLTDQEDTARAVQAEINRQVETLPRKDLIFSSLSSSYMVVLSNRDAMIRMVNRYSPEHLIIAMDDYADVAGQIRHAGSIFLGHWSPESAGDYASGTNHTLPTSGFAKAYSGVSLTSFMKSITCQELSPQGLQSISMSVTKLARAEGLEAHARAVEIRKTGNPQPLSLQLLVRSNIRALEPYSSARKEYAGRETVFLDANENPFGNGINRYPDPRQKELRQSIAELKGVIPEQVFTGNGSDEVIDLLIRIFCEPGQSRILTLDPSYGMYEVAASIQDVKTDKVLLNSDFSIDIQKISERVYWNTRLLFLCTPNNPTGNIISIEQIRMLTKQFRGVVVVDEAYIDFADASSALMLLNECPNLVVLQTFSKAWGLAGVRLGMAFARKEVISLLDRIKSPYNVNRLTQEVVLSRIREEISGKMTKWKSNKVKEIVAERERMKKQLPQFDSVVKVYPSQANFLLVRMTDARAVYHYLLEQGIVVRDRSSHPLCEDCLRITIGTPEENEKLLQSLQKFPKTYTNTY